VGGAAYALSRRCRECITRSASALGIWWVLARPSPNKSKLLPAAQGQPFVNKFATHVSLFRRRLARANHPEA